MPFLCWGDGSIAGLISLFALWVYEDLLTIGRDFFIVKNAVVMGSCFD